MPRLRRDRRDYLPVFQSTCDHTLIDPYEEVRLVGRHHDLDQNGIANQADPPEPEELDEREHNACATEMCHIGDETAYDGDPIADTGPADNDTLPEVTSW